MLEHVDAEHDVVLVGVERDPLEIHDAVLVCAGRAAALRLDHVDADDVARPRDLEALPAGLDVEDLEKAVARKDRVEEPLGVGPLDIATTGPPAQGGGD